MQNCTFSVCYFFNICLIFFWLKKNPRNFFLSQNLKFRKAKVCIYTNSIKF